MRGGPFPEVNRRFVIVLLVVLAVLIAPLGYMYLSSDNDDQDILIVCMADDPTSQVGISLKGLLGMDQIEGYSSYENFFGNWRGHGHYKGVLISDIVERLYHISMGDNITIQSIDGYEQTYCYKNVYNAWEDESTQGDMILAYEFNGTRIPDWAQGPMVVFIPPDGSFSNDYLLNTSCPGQGGHVYLSAGARWVQQVNSIVIDAAWEISFAVVGDTQGNSEALSLIVDEINALSPSFVLHLGDVAPFASEETLEAFAQEMDGLEIKWHMTPGNHDVKGVEGLIYSMFDTGDYYFDHGDLRFISVDSSALVISESQFEWVEGVLEASQSKRVTVFTHAPPFDPRPDGDHTLIDEENAVQFRSLMDEYGVQLVLAGHIHIFNHTIIDDIDYIISGGGGARLYAPEDQGGFHHFLLFNVSKSSIEYEVIRIEPPQQQISLEVIGPSGSAIIGLYDFQSMAYIEGYSSFENFFGNWRGEGVYTGVLVSDLIEIVGGMKEGDILRVESRDGYYQDFCYRNVYPDENWYRFQGDMIIAFAFDGVLVPDWDEGLRSAFLPEDGAYSIEDCLATSCAGQGCEVYPSAGARFVRDVVKITVFPA